MTVFDHGSLIEELYNLIVAVPAFANITGLNVGGMQPDPTLITLTPPACWVMFAGDAPKEDLTHSNMIPAVEMCLFMFNAFIYLPMAKQSNLISTHLPMLKSIIQGIRGKDSNTGHRWGYAGQRLALINTNRLVFAQRYVITGAM
jgi:hypothetical protein